jgi:integrase
MKGRRPSVKSLTPETRKIVERRREVFVGLGVYGPACYVFGKTTKQGNKGRPVVFGAAYNENDFITGGWRTARKRAGLDCTKGQALHFHDLRAEAACRLYEATGGDARRVMHFLDHRSLDETQKYIDRLVAHTERENADIMATFERRKTKEASGAPTPPASSQGTILHNAVVAFTAKNA